MSTMDGISNVFDYIKRAASWGHQAIVLRMMVMYNLFQKHKTLSRGAGIKMIYGCELTL